MAKYDVTPELAEAIKTVRIQNHITAKSIAEHIGKSQSYLSKLEKGAIKSIKEDELLNIFHFISKNGENSQRSVEQILESTLETLSLKYSDSEIEEYQWFINFDRVLRLIPIPDELVDDFNHRLHNLDVSIEYLCDRINANEGIPEEIRSEEKHPYNKWQTSVDNHQVKYSFIKMRVSASEISKILSKDIRKSNYSTILAIAYYLTKIEKHGDVVEIDMQSESKIMKEAEEFLSNHKFFSIAKKTQMLKETHSKSEFDELFSSFDTENRALLNELLKVFKLFTELDIEGTNKKLRAFVNNLQWDSGFIMRLLSISFSDLKDMSFTTKKELLSEIESIQKKYKNYPKNKTQIEIYD